MKAFLALFVLLFSQLGFSLTITCEGGDSEDFRRFDIEIAGRAGSGEPSLFLKGFFVEDGFGHTLAAFDPNKDFRLYTRGKTVKGRQGGLAFDVDLASGVGSWRQNGWDSACWPRDSQWCLVEYPYFRRHEYRLKGCESL